MPSESDPVIAKSSPVTDSDWTVHVLNIHGIFFERWCQHAIDKESGFRVVGTNVPVEFPPPGHGYPTRESALDVEATHVYGSNDLMRLIIECKKNNPDFTNWIFFPIRSKVRPLLEVPMIHATTRNVDSPERWRLEINRTRTSLIEELVYADEAREAKSEYTSVPENKRKGMTRTSNAAISDAAYQVAIASQARYLQEAVETRRLVRDSPEKVTRLQVILPIIATTARLYSCDFDPADVDPSTGEISYSKAAFTQRDYLVYKYALPVHLRASFSSTFALTDSQVERLGKLDIFVVNSENLRKFLQMLRRFVECHFFA